MARHLDQNNEEGFGITEALVAMIILLISLAATVLVIQNNLSTQQDTESYDSAVQIGYDFVERTRQADYSQLGFHMSDEGWRKEFAWKGKTYQTTTLPITQSTYNTPPRSSIAQGGVQYQVTTDIATKPAATAVGEQKFILVRVTWTHEDGTPETLDFESVRSARIDESIPAHLDEYTRIPVDGNPTMPRPVIAGDKVGAMNLTLNTGQIIVGERNGLGGNAATDAILTLSCDKGTVNYSHRMMRNLAPVKNAPGVYGWSPTKDFTATTGSKAFEGTTYKTWIFTTAKVPAPSAAVPCDLREGDTTVKVTFVNGLGFSNALSRTGYDVSITQEFING